MKRQVNITHNAINSTMSSVDNINLSNLDNIVNCSIDTLFCNILEYIPSQDMASLIPKLLDKIRKGGSIVIRFSNFKKICIEYINQIIDDTTIFKELQAKQQILSMDSILSLLREHTFVVNKIDQENNIITILAERTSI